MIAIIYGLAAIGFCTVAVIGALFAIWWLDRRDYVGGDK